MSLTFTPSLLLTVAHNMGTVPLSLLLSLLFSSVGSVQVPYMNTSLTTRAWPTHTTSFSDRCGTFCVIRNARVQVLYFTEADVTARPSGLVTLVSNNYTL